MDATSSEDDICSSASLAEAACNRFSKSALPLGRVFACAAVQIQYFLLVHYCLTLYADAALSELQSHL